MGSTEAPGEDGTDPAGIRTPEDFGQALTALRERTGATVRRVAAAAGVPTATVGGYFSGRHLPPLSRPEVLTAILAACGVTAPDEVAAWFDALRRVRRRRRHGGADLPEAGENPYPGLVSFGDATSAYFFGRETLTAAIVDRVTDPATRPGVFVVIGASGSGKSSLLRAGVVPALAALGASAPRITSFTPGPDPMAAWSAARVEPDGESGAGPEVIVVDQFEEVFTLAGPAERARFLQALVAAAEPPDRAGQRSVIVALRADFFGEAASEPLLVPALQERQIILGPLTDEQLETAIVEPARRVGSDVEPDLVRLLLHDATSTAPAHGQYGHNVGVLPRLAHALKATWDAAGGKPLTVEAYRLTGGVRSAVLQSAEQAWSRLDEAEQSAVRSLFLRLTNFGSRPTGRAVPLDDLELGDRSGPLATALDTFVDDRLLTIDATTVRVAHEALLIEWPRASEWLASNEREIAARRSISAGAREWAVSRDDSILLRGSRLAAAREILAGDDRTAGFSPAELRYVAASVEASESALRRERRRTRRLRLLVAAVSVLAMLTASLAVFFSRSTTAVRAERDRALSRQIATEAERIAPQDPAVAAELALAAYQTAPTMEARSALLNATSRPSVSRLAGPEGLVRTALSQDGRLLAVAYSDGTVRTWPREPDGGRLGEPAVTRVAPAGTTLFALTFSPSGKTLAVGGGTDQVSLIDVSSGTPQADPDRLTVPGGVYALAFDRAGTVLAAGGVTGDVTLFRVAADHGAEPLGRVRIASPVQAVQFGPTGLLAAGGNDATVRLFRSTRDGYRPAGSTRLGTESNTLYSLAFAPDGSTVAVGSRDEEVRFLDVTDPAHVVERGDPVTGFESWVNAVSYSRDGQLFAAGSSDSTVRVYRGSDHALEATLPAPSPVTAVTFLPNGSELAFGALDGITRLWQVTGPATALGSDSIAQVAFSRSGTELMRASLSGEGAVRLSDVSNWREPRLVTHIATEPGAGRSDGAAAMTGDGSLVATGSAAGQVRLWDTSSPGQPAALAVLAEPKALVESLAFSGDGHLLASGDDANDVHLWAVTHPREPRHLATLRGATAVVLGVAVSPDGRYVAAASADRTVRLWDIRDPTHPGPGQTLGGFSNYAYSVAFSPDSRLLAGGSTDRTVRVWRLTPGRPATAVGPVLAGPTSDVLSVAFNRDGTRLAGGTRNGTIWEWDVTDPGHPSPRAILNPDAGLVFSVAYSPSRDLLAAGGSEKRAAQVLDDPALAAQFVCANIVDPITGDEWAVHVPGVEYRVPCADRSARG